MAQFTVGAQHAEHAEPGASLTASLPLELGTLAFTTVILGCLFAGFLVPTGAAALNLLAAVAFFGGLLLCVSGMRDLRQEHMLIGTLFAAYGGFLMMLGAIIAPSLGILFALRFMSHAALGVFFLAWTIFAALLLLGALRTRVTLVLILALLFLSYLFLAIGELAGGSVIMLMIGGWLAIITGLIAWYDALACLLSKGLSVFHLPM